VDSKAYVREYIFSISKGQVGTGGVMSPQYRDPKQKSSYRTHKKAGPRSMASDHNTNEQRSDQYSLKSSMVKLNARYARSLAHENVNRLETVEFSIIEARRKLDALN